MFTNQVFRLENKEGTIPGGGGSSFLRWRFLPVEAKQYALRVTVRTTEKYEGHAGIREEPQEQSMEQSLEITLKGVGYDPRTRDPHRSVIFSCVLILTGYFFYIRWATPVTFDGLLMLHLMRYLCYMNLSGFSPQFRLRPGSSHFWLSHLLFQYEGSNPNPNASSTGSSPQASL